MARWGHSLSPNTHAGGGRLFCKLLIVKTAFLPSYFVMLATCKPGWVFGLPWIGALADGKMERTDKRDSPTKRTEDTPRGAATNSLRLHLCVCLSFQKLKTPAHARYLRATVAITLKRLRHNKPTLRGSWDPSAPFHRHPPFLHQDQN